jgi:hypothetical protein
MMEFLGMKTRGIYMVKLLHGLDDIPGLSSAASIPAVASLLGWGQKHGQE